MFRHLLTPRYHAAAAVSATATLQRMAAYRVFSSVAPAPASSSPEPVVRLKLNMLHDNPGATKQKRRKGRGPGTGRGRTCGRGQNGQKSRSGGSIAPFFNGGSTKYWKQFPKRGFRNTMHAKLPQPINLKTIAMHIAMKRLDPTQPIGLREMQLAGIFAAKDVKHGVKLLADGDHMIRKLPAPLQLVVNRASRKAVEAVESAGGAVTTVHMNRLALRTVLRPQKFVGKIQPKAARPPPKYQPYYTSWEKRGYLHPAVQMRSWFGKKKKEHQQQSSQDNDRDNKEAALEETFQQILEERKAKIVPEAEGEEEPAAAEVEEAPVVREKKKKKKKNDKKSEDGWD